MSGSKLKSTINNFQKNFLIVASYIHDVTSTYYNDKIFDELQRDILTFCTDYKPVMLIGDLNGRTGSLNDLYEEPDTQFCSPITQRKLSLNVPIRINCDVLVNSHGEKIIKLCKTFDLIILNGRLKGDAVGNFTHLNKNNGPSAIDYCICSNELYDCIDNFIVLPLTGLSDHSKIVSVFKEEVLLPGQNSDTYKWNLLKKKFKWNEKAVANFKSALINNTSEIEEISQRIDAGLVNSTGEKIQNLFNSAAENTLVGNKNNISKNQVDLKNWKKRKKSKKWFDKECRELKSEVHKAGKEKHNNQHNSLLRLRYHEKLKEYKTKCKTKRYLFWQNKFDSIEKTLGDSKQF